MLQTYCGHVRKEGSTPAADSASVRFALEGDVQEAERSTATRDRRDPVAVAGSDGAASEAVEADA
jgi:hypothetical protein